jgi:hypothetical protein
MAECVYAVLSNALRKFAKRWADLHLLVLEESFHAREQLVAQIVAALEPDEVRGVSFILVVVSNKVVKCYPSAG